MEPRTPRNASTPGRDAYHTGARTSFAPPTAQTSRRSSIFQVKSSNVFKDKRAIVSTEYKNKMIQKIHEFMEGEMTIDQIRSPTRRQFIQLFESIWGAMNDNYVCPSKPDQQNADIIRIFKNFGYPVVLKNSLLSSVNAPTSWPHLLAALGWMIDMVGLYNRIVPEGMFGGEDANNNLEAMIYASGSAVCKHFFQTRRDGMSTAEEQDLTDSIIEKQIPSFKHHLKQRYDLEGRREEIKDRIVQARDEERKLLEELETDQCAALQEDIKLVEDDIANLETYVTQLNEATTRAERQLEEKIRLNKAMDEKIGEVKAVIEEKKAKIEVQRRETGMDGGEIREMAMEKESLMEELKELNKQVEHLSKIKYNMAPKANAAFLTEQGKYRKLLQEVYEIRNLYLNDKETKLLESLPGDIRSLLDVLHTDVRRLLTQTKSDLESAVTDMNATVRRIKSATRQLKDEDNRVERELEKENVQFEKEEKQRETEREEWKREYALRERELNAVKIENETLKDNEKELDDIKREIAEAEIDLDETRARGAKQQSQFDAVMEERVMRIMEESNELDKKREFYTKQIDALEQAIERQDQAINHSV